MRDDTGKIVVNRFNGTAWDGFINIGGLASGDPICGDIGISGEAVCFGRGTDLALWSIRFNGGAWSATQWTPWFSLGGVVYSKGGCSVLASGQLICGATSVTDSALYFDEFNGTNWLGFAKLGQTVFGTPNCTNLSSGRVMCTVVSVSNKAFSIVGP